MGWVVVETMDGLIDVVPRKKARPTMPRLRGTVGASLLRKEAPMKNLSRKWSKV